MNSTKHGTYMGQTQNDLNLLRCLRNEGFQQDRKRQENRRVPLVQAAGIA